MSLKLLVLVGCLSGSVAVFGASGSSVLNKAKPMTEPVQDEIADARARALEPASWVTVAPGFRYRARDGGIDFWITPSLLSDEGFQQVEAHMLGLERKAVSDLDRFRLREWRTRVEQAHEDYLNRRRFWPTLQAQVREGHEKGDFPQAVSLQPAEGCALEASALATTAAPGAKAYATAYCSPTSPVRGEVKTATMTRVGNDAVAPCQDLGWASSQCRSVAYGSSNCYSAARAEHTYETSDVLLIVEGRYASNAACR